MYWHFYSAILAGQTRVLPRDIDHGFVADATHFLAYWAHQRMAFLAPISIFIEGADLLRLALLTEYLRHLLHLLLVAASGALSVDIVRVGAARSWAWADAVGL
jgi:hypothetical protein